jgi:serine/threonine-protein kinase
MKCPSCSAEVPENARYCLVCGQAISSISQMPTGLASPSVAAAAQRRSPSSGAPVGRLASSDSIETGGFTPGAVLAERYRIIGLLGRGGMGEVYRADDLKLGQAVALKFLPRALSDDAVRRERFYAEVRLARQVSHPNVCRVYDVGEIDGQHFLSMEYVDGEDLASLVKRIGRLPHDKALDLARELCAGLAAAHDRKVLHRDLKPANVMIDGRGRARITDFGLAVAVEDSAGGGEVAGTPAYMAPEQLEGKGASVKSDVHALGLVLYELFTGKKAFEGANLADLKRQKREAGPTAPSQLTRDLDPNVERVILRCLEPDPARRPASALQVAASLPGGDPLAAALAAGETPSPEMVAAAGDVAGLSPKAAFACFSAAVVGLLVAAFLQDRVSLVGSVPFEEPPEQLAGKAQEIAVRSGYAAKPADRAYGFREDSDYNAWVRKNDRSPARWKALEAGRAGIEFWYRSSPRALVPRRALQDRVLQDDPPRDVSGMTLAVLDPKGRLQRFEAVPAQVEDKQSDPAPAPDWAPLLAAAGLDPASLHAALPQWLPSDWGDARAAWSGAWPEVAVPIRIEAAAYRGKPISFRIIAPWTRPARLQESQQTAGEKVSQGFVISMFLALLVGGVLIARRNWRLSRGDRRGAFRLALFILGALLFSWAVGGTHVLQASELGLFVDQTGFALFLAALLATLYLALEPFVRRRWPDSLVSWTRLLAGQFRDPVVGRDLLIGVLLGVGWTLFFEMGHFAAALEGPPPKPRWFSLNTLLGLRLALYESAGEVTGSVLIALGVLFLLFLLRTLLRREWLAGGVFVLLFTASVVVRSETPLATAVVAVILFSGGVLVLLRFGVVPMVVAVLVSSLLPDFPVTRHLTAWYAPSGIFAVVAVLALAFYGFRTTLAGRPVFQGLLDE